MRKTAAQRYAARQRRKADRENAAAELLAMREAYMEAAGKRYDAVRLKVLKRGDCLTAELIDRHHPVLHWLEPSVQCAAVDHHGVGTWPCDVVVTLERHAECQEDRCARSE